MKKERIWLIAFALCLIVFALFAQKMEFHDTPEYITIAKYFSGIRNVNIFSSHSMIYPWLISNFLKIWPNFAMIRLINVLWIFLIGTVLLEVVENKKAFVLFAFSPLCWYIGIQTTPVLPASFFFLLAFVFYYKNKVKYNLVLSAFFLGISFAFYTPMILVSIIFILTHFWGERFSEVVKYSLVFCIGYLPRAIQDYALFNNPIYSLIRYGGTNFIVAMGLHHGTSNLHFIQEFEVFLIFLVISPLLFRLHRVKLRDYKSPLGFLFLSGLILFVRGAQIKYFLILAPVALIILSELLNEKEIKWHCIISTILILFLTWNFFVPIDEISIKKDLSKITEEYKVSNVIGGPMEALWLGANYWQNDLQFIWFQEYQASIENKTKIRSYDFEFDSEIPLKNKLIISASFNRYYNKTFEDYVFVSKGGLDNLEGYKKTKCYEVLCVYER